MVDWKRNDKLNLGHNYTDSFDFHDIARLLIMKMLRRQYPDKSKYPIYSEFDCLKQDGFPDIQMRIKGDIYVWELQKEITEKWTKEISKKYEDVTLIIVPLIDIEKKWNNKIKENPIADPLRLLKDILEPYVI